MGTLIGTATKAVRQSGEDSSRALIGTPAKAVKESGEDSNKDSNR